ncbi:MAG: sigma-54-dependent Fis family transcriptional regulator [Acidobacteria bacterium]|nr:sigma-54-dependent Fis family transcriptional regulator [Acidobacteriota bacterium]
MARRHIFVLKWPGSECLGFAELLRQFMDAESLVQVGDWDQLQAQRYDQDLILIEMKWGSGRLDGRESIRLLRQELEDTPIIALSETGSVGLAEQAVQAGATDFLVRSGDLQQRIKTMLAKVERTLKLLWENRQLNETQSQAVPLGPFPFLIGNSPLMNAMLEKIERVAKIPRPILIVGERGTGKELVARAIHQGSHAKQQILLAVNCAAFPEPLLESELFGHERGAFSGADRLRRGKFELAHEGTLFLDEIGSMPLTFQQKILRAVEYGTFTRVGGTQELKVQVRILAATNVDLNGLIEQSLFLPDLYDRLAFETIRVPALRERKSDIPLLAEFFLQRFVGEIPEIQEKHLTPEAVKALQNYHYPGNVRELKTLIERAAYRDNQLQIDADALGLPDPSDEPGGPFFQRLDRLKRQMLLDALKTTGGNQAAAARILGLSYHQFRYFYKSVCT